MYDRQTREAGLKVNQFVWLFDPSQRHSGYTLVKASRSTLRSLEAIPRGRVRKMDVAQNPRPHGWRAWKWRGSRRSGWPRGEWGWRRGRLQTLEHANEMEPEADLETAPLPPPSPDHNTRLDLLFNDHNFEGNSDSSMAPSQTSIYPGRHRRPPKYLRDYTT